MMRRTAVDMEQTENLIDSNNDTKSNKCLFITCSIVSHLSFTVFGYFLRYIQEETVCSGSNL